MYVVWTILQGKYLTSPKTYDCIKPNPAALETEIVLELQVQGLVTWATELAQATLCNSKQKIQVWEGKMAQRLMA